jgi:hypothetical protein
MPAHPTQVGTGGSATAYQCLNGVLAHSLVMPEISLEAILCCIGYFRLEEVGLAYCFRRGGVVVD